MAETMPATPWLDQLCDCGHKRGSHHLGPMGGHCLRTFPAGPDGFKRTCGCQAVRMPVGKYPAGLTAEQILRRERGW